MEKKRKKKRECRGDSEGRRGNSKKTDRKNQRMKERKKSNEAWKIPQKKTQNDRSYTKIVVSINRLNSLIK